jgi:hypothetical protein
LLVTANVVPSSLILSTLMMEAIRPCETSVFTRATRHHPRRRHFSVTAVETSNLININGLESGCFSKLGVTPT